jgi:acetylornithine/N-succinyldiaminopimelate aminotransferase
LVEPVQGEGGVRPLNETYLKDLRRLCDDQDWLLMFDEVQSGNGRCGALYAFQRIGVTPDVMTTAKGLGNGFPIGVCLAKGGAADVLGAGHHGTTFGGNPLACAVASAVINTLSSDMLWAQADPIREAVIAGFKADLEDHSTVTDIRGLGLMIGIETRLPCDGLVQRALDAGVIINVTAGNTLRLLPPLVMSLEQADELGRVVAQTLNEIQRLNP